MENTLDKKPKQNQITIYSLHPWQHGEMQLSEFSILVVLAEGCQVLHSTIYPKSDMHERNKMFCFLNKKQDESWDKSIIT